MNKSSVVGLGLCGLVVYFGVMAGVPIRTLLNTHALILVIGGTIGISLFSYSFTRLRNVLTFVIQGFLFKRKSSDFKMIEDLLLSVKGWYAVDRLTHAPLRTHPFIADSIRLLNEPGLTTNDIAHILKSRREAVKRKYFEDAQILNNIAKYPPSLGLLGAASGMIQMMVNLGKGGIETIGGAMAVALTATLWGIFINNFVFLPLSDSATKSAEDEMYFRDVVCEAIIMLKDDMSEKAVTETIVSRLMVIERIAIKNKVMQMRESLGIKPHAA